VNPEQLSRDAIRTIDQTEANQLQRITRLLKVIEDDAQTRLEALDLTDDSLPRAVRQNQIQTALNQSRAQQELLSLGRGPLADDMRRDILASYEDGLETGRDAILATTNATAANLEFIEQFGTRVELEFVRALTETTLTNLDQVGQRGYDRLLEELTRQAVRGAGPRAAARAVRDSFGVTRNEAERITRTVFMDANNRARDRMFEDAGITLVRYDATNDSRTCGFCASRHGMVYERNNAPRAPLHPNCRCVLLPYRDTQTPTERADDYYARTRRDLERRAQESGGGRKRVTDAAPFEKTDGRPAPRPVRTPDGRTYR
jgi:SPP1 gp7 family putative phage head morphogenesis protein